MPDWTQEEVIKFFNNSQRFQVYGSDMEYFLTQAGFLQQDVSLNDAINDYCQKVNVPDDIKNKMHIIRKNRNLTAHESIQDINKNEVIALDYNNSKEIEQYKQFFEKAKLITSCLNLTNEFKEYESLLNKNDLEKIKQNYDDEEDPLDENEIWTRKEVKKLIQNIFRFRTFGLNLEQFLTTVQQKQKRDESLSIFQGIEDYCENFNVPEKIKGMMHTIRMNRNLASHEGYQKFDKQDLIELDYHNSKQIEKYRKYIFYAQNSLKKWKIFILKKKGMTPQQIAQKIFNQQISQICPQKSVCRYNSCEKEHPEGKYCEIGKNCRNQKCNFQHSSNQDIFVVGLPGDIQEENIKDLFEKNAGPITYLKYSVKNSKGVAFITFRDLESYNKAFQLNATSQFDGRKMYVKSSDK